jgi:hypothetical protein
MITKADSRTKGLDWTCIRKDAKTLKDAQAKQKPT